MSTQDDAVQQHSVAPQTSTLRLVMTLLVAGVIAGLLIVVVYQMTLPTIQAYKAMKTREAVGLVLQEPARVEVRYVHENALHLELPAGLKDTTADKVFLGFNADGRLKGVAMTHAEPAFQDLIHVIFGYDLANKQLLGQKVLSSKETPGLGDKIELEAWFIEQFINADMPLIGKKKGTSSGQSGEIDMITGATISSKALIKIINKGVEKYEAILLGSDKLSKTSQADAAAAQGAQ